MLPAASSPNGFEYSVPESMDWFGAAVDGPTDWFGSAVPESMDWFGAVGPGSTDWFASALLASPDWVCMARIMCRVWYREQSQSSLKLDLRSGKQVESRSGRRPIPCATDVGPNAS